jgi:hypothetical protein
LIQAFNKKLSIIEAQRPIPSKVALEKTTTFFKTTDNLKKRRPRKTTTGVARKDSSLREKSTN